MPRRGLIGAVLAVDLLILAVEVYRAPNSSQAVTAQNGSPESGEAPGYAFVHRAVPDSISGNSTYLDSPLINGEPDAIIFITQSWNPGGPGAYNDHPAGVWYNADRERWAIFNQDREAMPVGAAFNVAVSNNPAER